MEFVDLWNSNFEQCYYTGVLFWGQFESYKISGPSLFQRCFREGLRRSHLSSLNLERRTYWCEAGCIEDQGCTVQETKYPKAWITWGHKPCSTGERCTECSTSDIGACVLGRFHDSTVLDKEHKTLETIHQEQGARNFRTYKFRVMEIGSQNPADIPSQGMTASKLVAEKRWWKGPDFLYKTEGEWPQDNDVCLENEIVLKEIVKNPATSTHALITTSQLQQLGVHQVLDVARYSSWKKLLQVTAYVLRFLGKADAKRSCELETEEIRSAEELWIKSIQCQSFPEEVCHLMTTKGTPVPLLVRQFNL